MTLSFAVCSFRMQRRPKAQVYRRGISKGGETKGPANTGGKETESTETGDR